MLLSTVLRAGDRVQRGLLVLYDFSEGDGNTIHDRSGVGKPCDLTVAAGGSVRWLTNALAVDSATTIVSSQPASKIINAVKKSNSITVEAWIKPANTSQSGPARIISLSSDTNKRNLTLGQDKDAYDVRLRTTASDQNGLPSTASRKQVCQSRLSHVVFVRNTAGNAVIFVDGKSVGKQTIKGNLDNWDRDFRLLLANEATGDRPWRGELHVLAIYGRALTAGEVQQNFVAGNPPSSANDMLTNIKTEPSEFETHIAPLFAEHCVECHDAAIRQGGLNLLSKETALAGGESGKVIVPGKSSQSLLWDMVSSDEMPKDRAPLSASEKDVLEKWLDNGARWTVDVIDPAIYLHEGQAGEVWVQRLTLPEYIATVHAAVGVDIAEEASTILPPDMRADGFSNTAYNLNIDLKHVEAYSKLAEITVGKMDVIEFASRFSKSRKLSTDDTMRDHVAAMGKWLLRGPLTQQEINNFSGIATTVASAGGGFEEAIRYIVEAMLQSPRFIYRIENNRGDASGLATDPFELASRMSYILWGAPPDKELYRAAESGELSNPANVESQVQRMLNDPRTVQRSEVFVSEWLNLKRLSNLRPDPQKFPNWNPALAEDMQQETKDYFEEVVWKQNRPLIDLLNAEFTITTPQLAEHYGLKSKGNVAAKYDLSQVPERGGLLTQGSVLTIGGDDASMVSRGLFVLHDLLRGTINAPPPCVNTVPPPTKTGLTQRGIAEGRIADAKCGVCHSRFEPLAFGLEKYDGIGAYHEQDEHGNSLRDDGEVLIPGTATAIPYNSSSELLNLLASSDRVRESLTWKVTQFALGRPLVAADAPIVLQVHKSSQEHGGTYSSLISAIVLSDLVQITRTEPDSH